MATSFKSGKVSSEKINKVEITGDTLTSRGGLSLFVCYVCHMELFEHLDRLFGGIRKSMKGQAVTELFKQILCFFMDGTSRHLVQFDALKEDKGYAATIESRGEELVSSHVIKRFFKAFSWYRIWLFRRLLQALFIWRLRIKRPDVVELGIDSVVMDNDEAPGRHGVQPTYKNVKGFKPLQMNWEQYVVDAVFRGGKKHCNEGDTVEQMVRHVVRKIRKSYRQDVPIVMRIDSGFFDQKLFAVFEELKVGYLCGGKLFDDIKAYIESTRRAEWGRYENGDQVWDYVEFGDKRANWSRFRRAVFCHPVYEGEQLTLDFVRPDTILYTNLGMTPQLDKQLEAAGMGHWLDAQGLIECYHDRGRDELVHRALKDFGPQTLPFKRFAPNAAFYYTMLVAFFLYEAFKEDVCCGLVHPRAYATTLRRKVIDVAAKIVHTSRQIILKVSAATWKELKFEELWRRSNDPPRFCWA